MLPKKSMIVCPDCGHLAHFNTYFGAYKCSNCTWKDESFNLLRAVFIKGLL